MRAWVATGLVLLLASAGMAAGVQAVDSYSAPTIDAFLKGIRSYPFVAGTMRRERLRFNVPKLTRCMASTEVRKLIGDPDFGSVGYKPGAVGIPSKVLWTYVLEKKAALEAEPSARVVVWFGADAKLVAITVHGAPDIEASVSRRGEECTR